MKKKNNFFMLSGGEITLWSLSVITITLSFIIFDRTNILTLVASLIGVTSLIFNAKGNPIGPALMIVFSLLYGIISFTFLYYGEMITYLGMSAPMAVFALAEWLRNPFKGNKAEVTVNQITKNEAVIALTASAAVTVIFYFILKAFGTANLVPSTISVTTSFIAVYLTFKRSPFYALAYAANDAVLILLWVLAALTDKSYISVVICFALFFINDIYGFINWRRMQKHQQELSE